LPPRFRNHDVYLSCSRSGHVRRPQLAPGLPDQRCQGWRVDFQDDGREPAQSVETLRRYVKDADAFTDHAGEDFL
jgi:hypothetical protein